MCPMDCRRQIEIKSKQKLAFADAQPSLFLKFADRRFDRCFIRLNKSAREFQSPFCAWFSELFDENKCPHTISSEHAS